MSAISIITPIGLGALHALEPEYGKTSMVSYSIANNIDKKQTVKIIFGGVRSYSLNLRNNILSSFYYLTLVFNHLH